MVVNLSGSFRGLENGTLDKSHSCYWQRDQAQHAANLQNFGYDHVFSWLWSPGSNPGQFSIRGSGPVAKK